MMAEQELPKALGISLIDEAGRAVDAKLRRVGLFEAG